MSDPPKVELKFDLNRLKALGLLGPKRASAFLCFGLIPTYGEPPKSATLDSAINIQFLPDPLPSDLGKQIVFEYRTWLVGNALRELDLHCHLGQQLRLEQGDKFTEITPDGSSFQAPDPSEEAQVVLRFVEKEKSFDIGAQIQFSPHELHEICLFYFLLTERLMEHVKSFFAKVGIVFSPPLPSPDPDRTRAGP